MVILCNVNMVALSHPFLPLGVIRLVPTYRKTNISHSLIYTRMNEYQEEKNVSFLEDFAFVRNN